ncbi:HoxN/HupN/NixA family nickel/cobalt transporter [Streptomyces galilaeus]|uniref:HoxN/HupN/NixA family nickel/cobalt transporter n=1 Tax=Streptomyces galilaeus TaxID=33899 RepID=UPI0038F785ED
MTTLTTTPPMTAGRWTRVERLRLTGIFGVIAVLHVIGWTLYLFYANGPAGAGTFAGAGTLAYTLGMRHAFDADHIAAIDDTTRLMMQRGRRPVGVGFFFAMGHSTVVLVIALIVALAAGAAGTGIGAFRQIGGLVSQIVAMLFLLLVAVLNAMVLTGIVGLWRRMAKGSLDPRQLELHLLNRGLMNRILGGRARGLIRSSWHMYPVGILFGLGLETASEVTLLSLSGTAAHSSGLPLLAVLSLPLLFAAGMSAFDTVDSMLMTRAYSWAHHSPARRLYYNMATTCMTVAVAAFIASVYTAGLMAEATGAGGLLATYASLADHFETLGYIVAATFAVAWLAAAVIWRYGRMAEKYDTAGAPADETFPARCTERSASSPATP